MDTLNIVVIDDDESIRWLFREILGTVGAAFKTTSSPSRGLELIREHQPELAIVDLKLGTTNGLEVAHQIPETCRGTQILFVTGYGSTLPNDIYEKLPVVGVLEKQFEIEELLVLVTSVVDTS